MAPSPGCGTLVYEAVDIGPSSLFADGKAGLTATNLEFYVNANRVDYPVGDIPFTFNVKIGTTVLMTQTITIKVVDCTLIAISDNNFATNNPSLLVEYRLPTWTTETHTWNEFTYASATAICVVDTYEITCEDPGGKIVTKSASSALWTGDVTSKCISMRQTISSREVSIE